MIDLHERFRQYDEVPVPDLWDQIENLAEAENVTTEAPRSRAFVALAAVVVALVLIGGPLLLLTSQNSAEPAIDSFPTDLEPRVLTKVDPPWGETVGSLAILGDGGIVAVTSNPDRVLWSPDRVDWFDTDPEGQVLPWQLGSEEQRFEDRIIVSTDTHVAIRSATNDGVWIAAPATGQWQHVTATEDEANVIEERILSLAANDSQILVVTQLTSSGVASPTGADAPASIPYDHKHRVWLIDTSDGTIEAHTLPPAASVWAENPTAIANWFDGQWLIAMHQYAWTDTDEGWVASTPVLTSANGRSWTIAESTFASDSTTSISVGPAGMIATECNFGGDTFWYSDDGVEWEVTTSGYLGHRSVYVDELGFLTYYKGSPTAFSPDGREWQSPEAAGITLRSYDDPDDLPTTGRNLFVLGNRLMQWSISTPEEGGDETR